MYSGRLVFAQLMDFLPRHEFRKCVRRYRGNYKVQRFPCIEQFLCMAFAQCVFRRNRPVIPGSYRPPFGA